MQPVSPPPADPALLNPTKVAGRRILAWFIDAIIGTIIVVGYAASTFTNTELRSSFEAELQCEVIRDLSNDTCININEFVYVGSSDDTGVMVLLWFGWVLLSTVILPSITGWSVGKLIAGIRVAKADTFEKAGFGANLVRALVWMLDAFPYFLPGLGGVLMLATAKNQRLGDLAAGTVVIRAASLGRPPTQVPAPTSAPPPGAFAPAAAAPLGSPPPPSAPPAATPPAPTAAPPPPSGFTPPPPAATPPPPSGFTPPPPAATPPPPTGAPPPPTGAPYGAQPPPPPGAPYGAQPPPPPGQPLPSPDAATPPVFPPPEAPVTPPPPNEPDPTEVMPVVPDSASDEPIAPADEVTTQYDALADTEPTTEHAPVFAEEVAAEFDMDLDAIGLGTDDAEPEPADPERHDPDVSPDVAPDAPEAPAPTPEPPAPSAGPTPEPAPPSEPPTTAAPRAGVDAPMWDDARNTYIQWDPELEEWMEWAEAQGRWVPISR